MAKKSSSGRSRPVTPPTSQGKGVVRKPQSAGTSSTATLIRPGGPESATGPASANIVADTSPSVASTPVQKPVAPAKHPAPRPMAATPAKPAAKPVTKVAAPAAPRPAARPTTSRQQAAQVQRARTAQRARQANLIAAENYSYVLGDLKLVVVLAVLAFATLIALSFVLPH